MTIQVQKVGKKWRLVEPVSGLPVLHGRNGKPLDGGGHKTFGSATRQREILDRYFEKFSVKG